MHDVAVLGKRVDKLLLVSANRFGEEIAFRFRQPEVGRDTGSSLLCQRRNYGDLPNMCGSPPQKMPSVGSVPFRRTPDEETCSK